MTVGEGLCYAPARHVRIFFLVQPAQCKCTASNHTGQPCLTCPPTIPAPPHILQALSQAYVEMRSMGMSRKIVSATPRQLESLIRLSGAHAAGSGWERHVLGSALCQAPCGAAHLHSGQLATSPSLTRLPPPSLPPCLSPQRRWRACG